MALRCWLPWLCVLGALAPAGALRVLLVLPTAMRSHHALGAALARALLARRHHVVELSPFGAGAPPPAPARANWTWVPAGAPALADGKLAEELIESQSFINDRMVTWRYLNSYTRHVTRLPELREFILRDRSHFDLVIVEEFFQSVYYMFAHKYKAPLIVLSTFGPAHYISHFMGNSLELASVPHEFIDYYEPMDFFQRVRNLGCSLYDLVFRKYYSTRAQDALAREVFGHLGELPSVAELESNVSLVLVNSLFSVTGPRPGLPNVVEVGGLHVEEPKPLDEELSAMLASSQVVVLLSFGSIKDLSQLPAREAALRALARLPCPVLARWPGPAPAHVPPNVLLRPWLPQNDLLAHPKLGVLVTHGGLMSALEAAAHGVPIVCVPFYGDQARNCRRAHAQGAGLLLPPAHLTERALYRAVRTVLDDTSYRRNAQELSARFRDRPLSAADTAAYWVEYCARRGGMPFARAPRRLLPWWQACYLDLGLALWLLYRGARLALGALRSLIIRRRRKGKAE